MTGGLTARDLARAAVLAEHVALRAGRVARRRFGALKEGEVGFKGRRDLVTAADLESERVVVEELKRLSEWPVLAEEAASSRAAAQGADAARDAFEERLASPTPCWVVDPLDGTTNFAHEHPFFAVSIALVEQGRPRVGVVHAPVLGETFRAVEGRGAWLEERRLEVCRTRDLGDAVFASGFPYRRDRLSTLENNVEHVLRFLLDVRGFRRCGSAALDLAFVAAGRYAFFIERQLEPWDVAAGALLVLEAGGRVSDQDGGEGWLCGRSIAASNGSLHDVVLERLAPGWSRKET